MAADVADRARRLGLSWDRSTVARIELGQRQVTAAELLLLPLVYSTGLVNLLPDEDMRFTDEVSAPPDAVARALGKMPREEDGWRAPWLDGTKQEWQALFDHQLEQMKRWKAAHFPTAEDNAVLDAVTDLQQSSDGTVAKLAARLGADRYDVAVAAWQLYGQSLSAERNHRESKSGGDTSVRARQARRGHVTRQLIEELRPAIAELEKARKTETTKKGRSRGQR